MSQTFPVPLDSDQPVATVHGDITNALLALQARFYGANEPPNPVPFMVWIKAADNHAWVRNATNDAWIDTGPALGHLGRQTIVQEFPDITAAVSRRVFSPTVASKIESVALLAESSSSGSDDASNEWTWALTNETTGLQLFSGTVGTFSTVAAIGGGTVTAGTVYRLVPDQNQSMSADDVLQFVVAQVGTPNANVTNVRLQVTLVET